MSELTPAPRCENCGGPIRRDNVIGICRRNPECERERWRKQKRERPQRPRTSFKPCKHPDGCPNPRASHGWCGMHWMRVEKYGDPGPAGPLRRPRIIHAGDVFQGWTALEDFTRASQLSIMCRCKCGTERYVGVSALLGNRSQSCGCVTGQPQRQLPNKREPYLRAGSIYALLTVLQDVARSTEWAECRCECGTDVKRRAVCVKTGNTRSCGCLRRKHGLSGHPFYGIWMGMVRRTTNPDDKDYHKYGGRGVGVFEGWLGMPDGFLRFAAHMGERPPQTTLDRINNDKGYMPGNVRWAPPDVQNGNRRKVDVLTRENAELRAQIQKLTAALHQQ